MDAYVFARSATSDAVATLARAVEEQRGIRVVCPLEGDQKLYVALTAPDRETLQGLVSEVRSLPGVAETSAFFAPDTADPKRAGFPTYIEVAQAVAFAVLNAAELATDVALETVRSKSGVVGATVVEDGAAVLAETTGKTFDEARSAVEALSALPDLNALFVSVGSAASATGLRTA